MTAPSRWRLCLAFVSIGSHLELGTGPGPVQPERGRLLPEQLWYCQAVDGQQGSRCHSSHQRGTEDLALRARPGGPAPARRQPGGVRPGLGLVTLNSPYLSHSVQNHSPGERTWEGGTHTLAAPPIMEQVRGPQEAAVTRRDLSQAAAASVSCSSPPTHALTHTRSRRLSEGLRGPGGGGWLRCRVCARVGGCPGRCWDQGGRDTGADRPGSCEAARDPEPLSRRLPLTLVEQPLPPCTGLWEDQASSS